MEMLRQALRETEEDRAERSDAAQGERTSESLAWEIRREHGGA